MFKFVKPLQSVKAWKPIEVTAFGMVSEPVKPLQEQKVILPMVVTELGMVNEPVKPLQL